MYTIKAKIIKSYSLNVIFQCVCDVRLVAIPFYNLFHMAFSLFPPLSTYFVSFNIRPLAPSKVRFKGFYSPFVPSREIGYRGKPKLKRRDAREGDEETEEVLRSKFKRDHV